MPRDRQDVERAFRSGQRCGSCRFLVSFSRPLQLPGVDGGVLTFIEHLHDCAVLQEDCLFEWCPGVTG